MDDWWKAWIILGPRDPAENEPWRVKITPAQEAMGPSPRRLYYDAKRLLGWPGLAIEEEWQASQAERLGALRRAKEQKAAKKKAATKPKRKKQ